MPSPAPLASVGISPTNRSTTWRSLQRKLGRSRTTAAVFLIGKDGRKSALSLGRNGGRRGRSVEKTRAPPAASRCSGRSSRTPFRNRPNFVRQPEVSNFGQTPGVPLAQVPTKGARRRRPRVRPYAIGRQLQFNLPSAEEVGLSNIRRVTQTGPEKRQTFINLDTIWHLQRSGKDEYTTVKFPISIVWILLRPLKRFSSWQRRASA